MTSKFLFTLKDGFSSQIRHEGRWSTHKKGTKKKDRRWKNVLNKGGKCGQTLTKR